jgi:hypothetical protein
MKTRALLIAGVAALLMATSAVHAERRLGPFYKPPAGSPSPWTEADGEDIIFFAIQGITCEGVNYSVWQPYNVKLQKSLDFLRLTPLSDTPLPANLLTLIRVGSAMASCVKWPAPGSEDTELGVLMELEVGHGETEVYPRVQA